MVELHVARQDEIGFCSLPDARSSEHAATQSSALHPRVRPGYDICRREDEDHSIKGGMFSDVSRMLPSRLCYHRSEQRRWLGGGHSQ